jgi:hypothetical protein
MHLQEPFTAKGMTSLSAYTKLVSFVVEAPRTETRKGASGKSINDVHLSRQWVDQAGGREKIGLIISPIVFLWQLEKQTGALKGCR